MAKADKLKISWFDHRTDVPPWIRSGIGQVVMEWSVLERELEELIRLLMDIDIQHGRIIVNKLNARGRVDIARNLIQAHVLNDKIATDALSKFMKLGEKIDPQLQNKRDMLTHGLWANINGDWYVLRLRQSRSVPELQPDMTKLSRAVLPQKEIVTSQKIMQITREIVSAGREIEALCDRLAGSLGPLRHTRPQYTRKRRDYRPRPKAR